MNRHQNKNVHIYFSQIYYLFGMCKLKQQRKQMKMAMKLHQGEKKRNELKLITKPIIVETFKSYLM